MGIDNERLIADLNHVITVLKALVANKSSDVAPAVDPYIGAREFEFTNTYNTNWSNAERAMQKRIWVEWIDANQPPTREMYEGVEGVGPVRWKRCGGIEVQILGHAYNKYMEIKRLAYDASAERAEEARRTAEPPWTGRGYLTSPSGKQKGPNGYYFGVFTLPGDSQ